MKKVDWKTIETKELAGLICNHLKDEVKMYVLQVILLILKLLPFGSCLFFWGISLQEPLMNGIDPSITLSNPYIHLYPHFDSISWGIILIPSYFILAKQVIFYLKRNIKTNIRPE